MKRILIIIATLTLVMSCLEKSTYSQSGTVLATFEFSGLNFPDSLYFDTEYKVGIRWDLLELLAIYYTAENAVINATNTTINITGKHTDDTIVAIVGAEGGSITIDGSSDEVLFAEAYIEYDGNTALIFETLEEAVKHAEAGKEVVLLRDVELSEILLINKPITLNGNGHTITSSATRAINVELDGTVTIKDLTIVGGKDCQRAINIINQPAHVVVDNVTATSNFIYAVNVATSAGAAKVEITDSDLTGMNVVNVAGENAFVTVDKTTLTVVDNSETEGYAALAIYYTAENAVINATNTTINITGKHTDDTIVAIVGAEGGSITIDGGTELLGRIRDGGKLPMFTSCCPGWMNFVEKHVPEGIPFISSTRSPQAIQGSLCKTYLAEKMGIDPARMRTISIMPCTAKKDEAARPQLHSNGVPDNDVVLTVRELSRLLRRCGIF